MAVTPRIRSVRIEEAGNNQRSVMLLALFSAALLLLLISPWAPAVS